MQKTVEFALRILVDGVTNETQLEIRRPCLSLTSNVKQQLIDTLTNADVAILDILQDCVIVECVDHQKVIHALKDFHIKDDIPEHVINFIFQFKRMDHSEESIIAKLGSLWYKLRLFQQEGVKFLLGLDANYNSAEMGLGKTLTFLATALFHRESWPVLAFAPSAVRKTIRNEIHEWLGQDVRVVVVESTEHLLTIRREEFDFLVLSYSLITRPGVLGKLGMLKFDVLLLDEAHYVKTQTSKRAQALSILAPLIRFRTLMSGTPGDSPGDMYSQIRMLYPELFPIFFHSNSNAFQYSTRYCEPQRVRQGTTLKWEHRGCANEQELAALMSLFTLRIRKDQVLTSLPAKIRNCVILDDLTREEYDLIELEKKKEKQENGIKQKDFKFMKSFRLTSTFKIPHVVNFLKETLIEDKFENDKSLRVIIFVHHDMMRCEIVKLLNSYGVSHICIHGGTPSNKRQDMQDEFQAGKHRIALLSITACGTGLTLTAASLVIFAEMWFTPSVMLQAEDRAHRIGQKKCVDVWYLLSPKTTDDINWAIIRKKQRQMNSMIEGTSRDLKAGRCKMRFLENSSPFAKQEIHKRSKIQMPSASTITIPKVYEEPRPYSPDPCGENDNPIRKRIKMS